MLKKGIVAKLETIAAKLIDLIIFLWTTTAIVYFVLIINVYIIELNKKRLMVRNLGS